LTPRPARALRTYRLTLEYAGTRFAGWQVQPGRRTAQGELETALRTIFRCRVPTVGAARTDAGVHAAGQVASFRAPAFAGNLAAALNRLLPEDIAVLSAAETTPSFHARYGARSKTYSYRLVNRPVRSPLEAERAGWVAAPLDLRAMRREAAGLKRLRDFSDFAGQSARRHARSPFCRIKSFEVARSRDGFVIEITADRFVHNMARRLVGRIIEAGLGRRPPRPRTAEPQGLCLERAWY
jgi:tRNA pseudouridine38-40 synthase